MCIGTYSSILMPAQKHCLSEGKPSLRLYLTFQGLSTSSVTFNNILKGPIQDKIHKDKSNEPVSSVTEQIHKNLQIILLTEYRFR